MKYRMNIVYLCSVLSTAGCSGPPASTVSTITSLLPSSGSTSSNSNSNSSTSTPAATPTSNPTLSLNSLNLNSLSAFTSSNGTWTYSAPSGNAFSSVTIDFGSNFTSSNICNTAAKTLGVQGSALCRSVVPDVNTVDDGYCTSDVAGGCNTYAKTSIVSVTSAQHNAFVDCGTTNNSISSRISDCFTKNGPSATWNGNTNGSGTETVWNLVTHMGGPGSNKEVWQDQNTGLLWSSLSKVPTALVNSVAAPNMWSWCAAIGSVQDAGSGYNCTTYNPSPISACVELSGYSPNSGFTTNGATVETPLTGPYGREKGGMGLASSPSVRWRSPRVADFLQADNDGLRFVMPDMGAQGSSLPEWTGSVWGGPLTVYRARSIRVRMVKFHTVI